MGVNVNWPNRSTELESAYPLDGLNSRKKISRYDIRVVPRYLFRSWDFHTTIQRVATMPKPLTKLSVTLSDYRALAEFRYQITRYLGLSDDAARSAGLLPGQYRLLVILKGLPEGMEPTIGNVAARLGLRHHSTVELVDRLEERGLVSRERSERHRSFVFLRITPKGETIIRKLVLSRKKELQKAGPILVKALNTLIKKPER